MPAVLSADDFLELVRKSGVVDEKPLSAHLDALRAAGRCPGDASQLGSALVSAGLLTDFQAENLLAGRWKRFTIGKYKVLSRIGSGGMGQVFLCEHKLMRRRVAVKVLPAAKAQDELARERFYREARAVAALDHPNIVHAYDIDQDDKLHFLVMEYVDGANLQDIVQKQGPLDVPHACHYVRQAALGLDHASHNGIVHRDIKPGNILIDRAGVAKILDMGLARFFNDEDDPLTAELEGNVLGTADYLAPEQAIDSHGVDVRADIYSLGGTFYFLLTGRTPFGDGTVSQKLLWHANRQPKPIGEFRKGVPPDVEAIVFKMMAKSPDERYQTPADVARALIPFTLTSVHAKPPPEMPHLIAAASSAAMAVNATRPTGIAAPSPASESPPVAAQVVQMIEGTPWEGMASDTAKGLVTPDKIAPAIRVGTRAEVTIHSRERRRLRMVIAAIAVPFVLIIAVILWVFVLRQPAVPVATARPVLVVTREPTRVHHYKSIQLALRNASRGDVIHIDNEVHEENVYVDPSRGPTEVTLRAVPGKLVSWKSARKDETTPLLSLSKAFGFKLVGTGLTLDGALEGKRRVKDLVSISLLSPDLTVAEVRVENFAEAAIHLMNAAGEANRPIRILGITGRAEPGAAGILFNVSANLIGPSVCDYIEIDDSCRFEGLALKDAVKKREKGVVGTNIKLPVAAK